MNFLRVASLVCIASSLGGCASYQLGNANLFRNDIRTVYVPIIRSDSFRPDLGVRLTEALQKEIERRTPYKVVDNPLADSILTCRLVNDTKRVLTETATDEPRALESSVLVETSWIDRNGRLLMENRILPPGDLALSFTESSRFVPEVGQSVATSFDETLEDMAQNIVDQMEMRW